MFQHHFGQNRSKPMWDSIAHMSPFPAVSKVIHEESCLSLSSRASENSPRIKSYRCYCSQSLLKNRHQLRMFWEIFLVNHSIVISVLCVNINITVSGGLKKQPRSTMALSKFSIFSKRKTTYSQSYAKGLCAHAFSCFLKLAMTPKIAVSASCVHSKASRFFVLSVPTRKSRALGLSGIPFT